MKQAAETVASWWITWVLFTLVAWLGAGAFLAWAIHRCRRHLQGATIARDTAAAADDQPVPYWPAGDAPDGDELEWRRIVRAIKEDGL